MRYNVNFRCYMPDGTWYDHKRMIDFTDIPKWIECYKFTHPLTKSISIKVWFNTEEESE